MGFELEDHEKKYHLVFEDYPGLEVTTREPSVDQLLQITELSGMEAEKLDAAKLREIFALFAGLLVEWNVTRKGEPVPADYAGIASMSAGFVKVIMDALGKAFTEPDPTSPPASTPGGNPLEASLPMEVTSPSPPS